MYVYVCYNAQQLLLIVYHLPSKQYMYVMARNVLIRVCFIDMFSSSITLPCKQHHKLQRRRPIMNLSIIP